MASSLLATTLHPAPFDLVAESYDDVFTKSLIGRAQRDAVWRELERVFVPGQRVLEINCGTGVDAVHLAERGVEVLACDVAPRMIGVARRRLIDSGLRVPVQFRVLATEDLPTLNDEGPFDGAFSNFAGLNCVSDLSAVARQLAQLLRPGANALLCMASPFVAWEVVWYTARGNFRKAFRRFRRGSIDARLTAGATVRVQYYSARRLARLFAPHFRLREWKGVGVAVPPSYVEPLAQRFPRVLRALAKADQWLGPLPLLRSMADHILLQFARA